METQEPVVGLQAGSSPDLTRVLREEEQETARPSWKSVYREQTIENHIVPTITRMQSKDDEVDPDYTPDFDRVLADYERLGIPLQGHESWAAEFADVGNEREHQRLLDRHFEKYQHEKNLAELGGAKAVGAVLASYASDPLGFSIDAATGGWVKGALLIRMLRGSGQAVVATAAVEAALAADGETVEATDVAIGLATAGILGGAFGSIFGARGPELEDAAKKIREGLEPTRTSAGVEEALPEPLRLFHGSAFKFDRFSMDKVGSGEGAQAFGYGLYFAERGGIGSTYRHALSFKRYKEDFLAALPEDADFEDVAALLGKGLFTEDQERIIRALDADDWLGFDHPSQAISAAFRRLDSYDPSDELRSAVDSVGNLYEAEISGETVARLLDWDKPLSEQSSRVQKALQKLDTGALPADATGEQLVRHLESTLGQREASAALADAGIPGLRYLDGVSRKKGEGTRNVVIFDDALVSVLRRNDEVLNESVSVPTRPVREGADDAGAARNVSRPDLPDDTQDRLGVLEELRDEADSENFGSVAMNIGRFDMAAVSQRSNSSVVRKLGRMMFNDPLSRTQRVRDPATGKITKQFTAAEASTEERAASIFGRTDGELRKVAEPAFAQWYNRTRGFSRVGGAVRRSYDAGARQEFFELVGRYRQSGKTLDVPDEVRQADEAYTRFFRAYGEEMRRVDPEAPLLDPETYMPQRMTRERLNVAFGGLADMHIHARKLVAKGIKSYRAKHGLEIDDEVTELVAKAYVHRVMRQGEGRSGLQMSERGFLDLEDADVLDELVSQNVLDAGEAARLKKAIAGLKRSAKDTANEGKIDPMKRRIGMDKDVTIKIDTDTPTASGEPLVVTLGDLFDTNMDELSFNYGRSVAGDIAFREKGTSARQVEKQMAALDLEASASEKAGGIPGAATKSDIAYLKAGYRSTMGLPLEEDAGSLWNRSLRLGNAAGYITKMGMGGLNAIMEAFSILAYGGVARTLKNLPELRNIFRDLRHAPTDSTLYREIQMLTGGLGDTLIRNMSGLRMDFDTSFRGADRFSRLENFAEGSKKLASYSNMLAFWTDLSRKYSAVNGLNQLDEILTGKAKAPGWWNNRRLSWTLSDENMELVKDYLTGPGVTRGRSGELVELNYGSMPDDVRVALESYLYRYVGESIQQVEAGNLPKFMTTGLGRLVMMFRGFITGGHVRHMLKDVQHFDGLAFAKFAWTSVSAALIYGARVHLQHPTNEEKREELMEFDRVVRSATGYAVNVALLPDVLDTLAVFTTGSPVWGRQRTSGLQNHVAGPSAFIASNPALTYATDVTESLKVPFALARGGELDRGQASALFNVVGLDTVWWMSGAKNALLDELPRASEKTRKPLSFYDED